MARHAREATLNVSAMEVELARSSNFFRGSPPSPKVHVVTVAERNCPEGDEPIAWYLVTNEPIATSEQVAAGSTPTALAGSSRTSSRR